MRSLREQLTGALAAKGWTVVRLLAESKLGCDRSSLHRKLRGLQPLHVEECQALAEALGITIAWTPDAPARRVAKRGSL